MLKILFLTTLMLLLTACGAPNDYETMSDEVIAQPVALKMQPVVDLPADAVQEVFGEEGDMQLYFCEDYTLSIETKPSGDLQQTVLETTGFDKDQLKLLETQRNGIKRYLGVWSAVGEQGDEVGRICVLDDGGYHYVLSVTAAAEKAGELAAGQWQQVFSSFRLLEPEQSLNSGS